MSWRHIPVSLTELCIDTTLRCGQSFRWRKSDDGIWSCALHGRLLSLRQDDSHLYYQVRWPETKSTRKVPLTPPSSIHGLDDATSDVKDDTEAFLRHYLNLAPNLTSLYEQWSQADANFKKKAPRFAGVRILRQDAWEALVGFICSSNNNIARISQMMEKLCIHYGTRIGALDGREFHDMPTPAALTGEEVEAHLRELGFGYRAKYLRRTAAAIIEREEEEGTGWLDRLRNPESPAFSGVAPEEKKGKSSSKVGKEEELPPGGREGYRHAHEQLLALQGVGPKVADCVCLMGLGWGEAIPVDTHVWQIAVRDYRFGKGKHASLTKATYDAIGDQFRKLWGKEAGWAHSVLFAADLRTFAERLTAKIEIKEDVIKTEKETVIKTEETIKTEVASPEKRRRNNEQPQLLDGSVIEEKTTVRTTRSKRRRQG